MAYIIAVICAAVFLAADQFSKFYVVENFALAETKPAIDGLFDFTYIHNKGGAWGFLDGQTWLLLSFTAVALILCIALLVKSGKNDKLLFFSVCLILSGGVGNMIDRIFRDGNVVDFIHLQFMSFPIFNIADCAVVIGAALLVVYFIEDLVFPKSGERAKLPDEGSAE